MPSKRGFDEADFKQIEPSNKRARRQSLVDYADEAKPHHIHLHTETAQDFEDALNQEFPRLGAEVQSEKKKKPDGCAKNELNLSIKKIVLSRMNGRSRSPLYGLDIPYQEVYNLLEHTVSEGVGNSCLIMGPRSCGKTLVSTALALDIF